MGNKDVIDVIYEQNVNLAVGYEEYAGIPAE